MNRDARTPPVFLFLQGPHGPFFHRLGRMLQRAGADVWRVGFNAGDRAFWFQPSTYIPYRGTLTDWATRFDALVAEKGVTDIVLYGDTRPVHAQAVAQHVFYGALYHWFVMFRNGDYRNFRTHRDIPVIKEFQLYAKRLMLMPLQGIERRIATMRIRYGGFPYHLVLLQLEHDSSFQMHSPFETMTEFLELAVRDFAKGAPRHHHLVFKAHPLEDGRVPVRKTIRALAKQYGVADRVHYVRGGKLAQLLNDTRTAITVNSTAGQQVLWRGIPLKTFGAAVYSKPEFVSDQPLPAFFEAAERPDNRAYKDYRRYLLETSQVPGGFYSARGRRQLLRQVVDMMLSGDDPYDALQAGTAAPRQQLRVVN